jgi:hypothetical protein
MFQIIGQRYGRLVARGRIALQTTSDNCFQIAVKRRS